MKILVAPNSMKGSLNAFDFADIVEEALLQCSDSFEIRKAPVADGGDYTGEVLQKQLKASVKKVKVKGPLGEDINSKYFISEKTAVIEMADASGMKLIDSKLLNPLKTSTFGTGQLIQDAIKKGCEKIFIAIGGSATVDGGMGMMEALDFKFFDEKGNLLQGNGKNLNAIKTIKKGAIPENIEVKIICDVDNTLLGETGAASVFGPQKGATPEMVTQLESGLNNWSRLIKKECNIDFANLPGAGAAGGMAVPLMAFYNAEIVAGADFILTQLNFEEQIKWADIVITGEGKIDSQTLNNKAPFAVSRLARKYKKPVFAFGGKTEKEASPAFDGIYSFVNGPISLTDAMKNVKPLLFNFTVEWGKTLRTLISGCNGK